MTKKFSKRNLYWFTFGLFILFLFSPVCIKFFTDTWGETWLTFIRPLLICTTIISACFVVKHKSIALAILSIFMIMTICEWVMIRNYSIYMDIDHFMAFATTNLEESTTFASNNLQALWYIVPMVFLFIFISIGYIYSVAPNFSIRLKTFLTCTGITLLGVIPFEKINDIHTFHDVKSSIFDNTLTTPPMNIAHLTKITIRKIHRSMQTNDFVFNSTRTKQVNNKEIYVLAIGESVRYANCSLNGTYPRKTMPSLECQSNLLFFHNYYSGGCSTSISVPMIVTRATAEENSLSYQERSIVQVFNENDFTTVVIKRGILSQISSAFLYQGVDYTVDVSSDAEVFQKIDSLSKEHEKLFVMFQLQGSHFYYDNFPEEFNEWSPNCKYDKGVESDSLYINGYDNTILYTDYLLNSMIDSLEKQEAIAAVWYVSDHGQTITATQGWHGSVCDENEYHVPLCIWYSDEYKLYNENAIKQLGNHIHTPINSDNIFYTICGMTHIELPESYAHDKWDISSDQFEVHPRKIIVAGQIRNLDE